MSQAIHSDSNLRSSLIEHREAFKTLADHDDERIAELLGDFPLRLIDDLPEEGDYE